MATFNRRDFFKMVGVSGAAGLTACDVKTPVEQVLPYVVQPEQITPGVPTFFATTWTDGTFPYGAVMRNREGRVIFIGGNGKNPVGQGGLSPQAVAGTQDIYDPDRFTGPQGVADWAEADTKLAGALSGAAWLGRYRTGALARLIGDVMDAAGGTRVHWEPYGYEATVKATEQVFGEAVMPRFVVDEAQVIVSFGADWMHTWGPGVDHSAGYARARDPKSGHVAEFVEIGPRVSHTGTKCDTYYKVSPGAEVHAANALASLVAEKKGVTVPWLGDAKAEAEASGIALEKLQTLADKLADKPSVVFPGGVTNQGVNATALAAAALTLNYVCGNIGSSVVLHQPTNLGQVNSFADVKALLADCAAGKVKTLFIDGLDPVFALPADLDAAGALAKVENLVIFANTPDETTAISGAIVLPPGTCWENWGDAEGVLGWHGLQQPGMLPLHDTRGIGDTLLALAKAASLTAPAAAPVDGDAEASEEAAEDASSEPAETPAAVSLGGEAAVATFAAKDFYRYVAGHWAGLAAANGVGKAFDTWWVERLHDGGFFTEQADRPFELAGGPAAAPVVELGGGTALLVYPHHLLLDGRGSQKAWLQEIPHAVSGYTWASWAEMSQATADGLGITDVTDDTVVVKTDAGSVEVGVRISKGMPDNAVAVVLGNGATAGGRYRKDWGANGFRLLSSSVDETSGAMAYLQTTATLSKGSGGFFRKSQKGSESMDNRPIANAAYVKDVMDGVDIHPGPDEGRGIHIVEDPRLIEAGVRDFYPVPEHPRHRWALNIDIDSCNACGACEVACMSENNISIAGPEQHWRMRYMNWIRMDRFWEGEGEHPDVRYLPAVCQQCNHAPCEGVCPVVATYHNLDGLNAMIYNRCVGTRYCANNCPYSARRFNWHTYKWPEAYNLMLNPDVSTREMGVMEKCTFCIQRIRVAKADARPDKPVDNPRLTACAEVCPTNALTFGDSNDPDSKVSQLQAEPRSYQLLGELNTKNGVQYSAKLSLTKLHKPEAH